MPLASRVCLVAAVLCVALHLMASDAADDPNRKGTSDQSKSNLEAGSAEETVYDLGPGISAPRLVHQVRPERGDTPGFRLKGKVVIALVVSSAGQPAKLKVVESLDKDVDQSALRAVEQWRFQPARKDGKAVAVRVSVEISFNDI